MNAPLPQASYPCGNFSDTSSRIKKGGIMYNIQMIAFVECSRNQYVRAINFHFVEINLKKAKLYAQK